MIYGCVSQDEMEVTIGLDRESRQAHICSAWPEWTRKLERLYGSPKRITERDGKVTSAFWTIPLRLVTLRKPGRRTRVSEALREAARERMRQLHNSRLSASSVT